MAHKIFAFLAGTLLASASVISPAFAVVDEFSPRFTNTSPAAFGDATVSAQDLIAHQDSDDITAEELNAIMPAAGGDTATTPDASSAAPVPADEAMDADAANKEDKVDITPERAE